MKAFVFLTCPLLPLYFHVCLVSIHYIFRCHLPISRATWTLFFFPFLFFDASWEALVSSLIEIILSTPDLVLYLVPISERALSGYDGGDYVRCQLQLSFTTLGVFEIAN